MKFNEIVNLLYGRTPLEEATDKELASLRRWVFRFIALNPVVYGKTYRQINDYSISDRVVIKLIIETIKEHNVHRIEFLKAKK